MFEFGQAPIQNHEIKDVIFNKSAHSGVLLLKGCRDISAGTQLCGASKLKLNWHIHMYVFKCYIATTVF